MYICTHTCRIHVCKSKAREFRPDPKSSISLPDASGAVHRIPRLARHEFSRPDTSSQYSFYSIFSNRMLGLPIQKLGFDAIDLRHFQFLSVNLMPSTEDASGDMSETRILAGQTRLDWTFGVARNIDHSLPTYL